MADKITSIKIKQKNGSYTTQIPVSVSAQNVQWDGSHSLLDILGSVDVNVGGKGNVQHQFDDLYQNIDAFTDDINSEMTDFTNSTNQSITNFTNSTNQSIADFTNTANQNFTDFTNATNQHLSDVLGNISTETKGTVQAQMDKLQNDMNTFHTQMAAEIGTDVSDWLQQNVTPAGSMTMVDNSLTISDAAADAKAVGDALTSLNGSLENHFRETPLSGWSYFVGTVGSGKIVIDNNLITAYKRCDPNAIYTVRKIVTSRFRIFFTANIPVEGEIIEGDVVSDDSATSMKVTSPESAKFICVYLWHKLLDTEVTMDEVLSSLTLDITGAVDAVTRSSIKAIAPKAEMINGGEIVIPWERGGLSLTGDAQENSRNRVRSDFITGNKLSVKITSNLIEYSLRYYNDAGECIGGDTAFRTADADDVFSNFEGTTAIRILARLAANSNITSVNLATITDNLKVIDMGIREQIKNLDGRIPTVKSYYISEIADTTRKVIDLQTEPCVTFALITDIHYKSVDGSAEGECLNELLFEDTALNMKAVADGCKLDFVFCNGDFTDGDIEKSALKGRVKEMMDLFRMINRPFLCSVGNHDDNRYSSPVSLMDSGEIFANYVGQISKSDVVYGSMNGTNYYFDFANLGIRFIVINSNTFTGAYGYTEDTRLFVSNTLASMPEGYQGFLFVHTSPATIMNYNQAVRPNGADLETIINNSGRMCAMFYGHSHQDNSFGASGSGALNVYDYLAICTCCAKCTNSNGEASKWSPNATMPTRTLGTYTEDLWDVVVIRPTSRKINFVRFGAGADREFTY